MTKMVSQSRRNRSRGSIKGGRTGIVKEGGYGVDSRSGSSEWSTRLRHVERELWGPSDCHRSAFLFAPPHPKRLLPLVSFPHKFLESTRNKFLAEMLPLKIIHSSLFFPSP